MIDERLWHPVIRREPIRLIDGTNADRDLMGRKINGEWQYRLMTSEEIDAEMIEIAGRI